MALTLSRIDRLSRSHDVTARFPSLTVTGVDVALLPPRSTPTAATVWTAATYANGTATVLLAGPDADSAGALAVSASADLWMRVTDAPEVDAEYIERITVLGAGSLAPLPSVHVASVNGRTGAVVLDAEDVGALSAAFGRFKPPTFVGLGDSITTDGGRVWNNNPGPDRPTGDGLGTQYAWHFWGQLLSDSRALWEGNFGSGGQTIEQIRDTYLPYLLAKTNLPTYCVLLAGQNNLGAVTGATLAAYTDIVDRLMARGITPILCTLTPSITARAMFVMNTHIRQLAHSLGLPLVDIHAAVINETTGTWQAALTRDGIHPTAAGAHAMGQALSAVLTDLVPVNVNAAWLPQTQVGYGGGRAGTGSSGNELMLDPYPGYPDIPAGHDVLGGYYAGSSALTTPGAPVAGRRWTVTSDAGHPSLVARYFAVSDAQPGDEMLVVCRLSAAVEAHSGGGWRIGVVDGDSASMWDMGRSSSSSLVNDVTGKILVLSYRQGSNPAAWLDVSILGTGASVSISEATFYNLTGLGVA